ncbi:hypothetical protein GCWU000342_01974 [Shuttleworthella satelles DSM 14600]|uniref:Uncharacterized protein n=1 Tax=Shuttleworthella satelles DSM 14600 TaxID=626523 RepID=C4GE28_9FIRM|nr:hypothetical protein GCWU000342_01974 [Shuttleworthia satelles DSM 14600]
MIDFIGCFESKAFSWSFVHFIHFALYIFFCHIIKVVTLRKILSKKSICIFICSSLPRMMWQRKIKFNLFECKGKFQRVSQIPCLDQV